MRLDIPGYESGRFDGAEFIVLSGAREFVRAAISEAGTLYAYAATHPEAEAMRGRGTIYAVPGPGPDRWIVRKLSHGGLLAPLTGDRFLRAGLPRPFNELRISHTMSELGIPTPRVAAAVVYRSGPFYRGEVAREEVAGAADLAACLYDGADVDERKRGEALAAAGRLIGAAHRAGLIHPDLNLKNVLVQWTDTAPRAYILDVEKCRTLSSMTERQRHRMLRRFWRSALKFERQTGRRLSQEERNAFTSAYAAARADIS